MQGTEGKLKRVRDSVREKNIFPKKNRNMREIKYLKEEKDRRRR